MKKLFRWIYKIIENGVENQRFKKNRFKKGRGEDFHHE